MPLITDTPNNEINPIAADMLKSRPETYSPTRPPEIANGSPSKAKKLSRRGIEQPVKRHKDKNKGRPANGQQPLLGLLKPFELAGKNNAVAGRELHSAADTFLRLRHSASEVAATHAEFDRYKSLVPLAENVGRTGIQRHRSEFAEGNVGPRRLRSERRS